MNVVAESGGKYVFTNSPLTGSTLLPAAAITEGRITQPGTGHPSVQMSAAKLRYRGMRWYNTEFPWRFSGPTNTAFRHQTRYILSSRDLLASNRADQDQVPHAAPGVRPKGFVVGSPSDRLAWALDQRHILPVEDVVAPACGTSKRGKSFLDASLHCTSPEEDA